MKATGIVRRLDNLGRLVIPKEIRKQYQLKEGDSIEFFVEDQQKIMLKKFSLLDDKQENIDLMCKILEEKMNQVVLFVHDEKIMSVGHSRNDHYKVAKLSNSFLNIAKNYHPKAFEDIFISINDSMSFNGYVVPIVVYGDYYGSFIILNKGDLKEKDVELVLLCAELLTKQYEV